MSSEKRLSAKFQFAVTGIAVCVLWCSESQAVLAEHEHGTCPDYSQYQNLLDQGKSQVTPSSSPGWTGAPVNIRSRPAYDVGAFTHKFEQFSYKDPTLQQYILNGASSEDREDLEDALRWWSAADDRVRNAASSAESDYVHSLLLSRIADLKLVQSQHLSESVVALQLPYLTWQQSHEAALLDAPNQLMRSYLLKKRRFEEAAEYFRPLPTKTGKPFSKFLRENRYAVDPTGNRLPHTSILCHVPFPSNRMQTRLLSSLENCIGRNPSSEAESKLLLSEALSKYEESIRIRKGQPDNGSNAMCIMDLVKVSIIERALGHSTEAGKALKDAVKRITASAETNLPIYLFVDDVQASLLSSRLFYKLVSRELCTFALKNLTRSHVKVVEDELEHYCPKRWGASVIAAYADMGDKENTIRLFKAVGGDVFSQDANKGQIVEERFAIAQALIDVGAIDEFNEFVSKWETQALSEAPNNISVQAFHDSALASLYLHRGDRYEALRYLREFVRLANLLPAGDRGETQFRFQNFSALLKRIKTLSAKMISPGDVVAIKEVDELKLLSNEIATLKSQASHRLQKLECLELSDDLVRTAGHLANQGKYDEATKLFDAAIDIRTKNLGAYDSQTVDAQIQVARVLISAERLPSAAKRLELVTTSMRKAKVKDIDQFRMALEMYADVLSKVQQSAESDRIYAELRALVDDKTVPELEPVKLRGLEPSLL